ncbi:MAG: class I SAM-dependent methyltransferase [Chloroflexi bacterium]|nr:class I SAM-dependent methyltransferase [Chloroflexota bacterium]
MQTYNRPLYYEIAFGFVNPKEQVDLFEKLIKKYGEAKAGRFLDIGCGPGLQLLELAKRGHEAVGLDKSAAMLGYLRKKAKREGLRIETIRADMTDFKLTKKGCFAFIMMGTIGYFKSSLDFLKHLDSVGNSVQKGGLYFIENFALDWADKNLFEPQVWTMEKDGIKVRTTYKIELKDTLKQVVTETLEFVVDDHGKKLNFGHKIDKKIIFPQEFLALVESNKKLEFIGWFEHNGMKPLKKAWMDNYILLRRK